MIGAGNFTGQVLLPALKKTGVRLKTIASSGGVSGTHLGKKFGFEQSTTDAERIFADTDINTVFITTRHNTHAHFVQEALKIGKNIFVEKPLCINEKQLSQIIEIYSAIFTPLNSMTIQPGRNPKSKFTLLSALCSLCFLDPFTLCGIVKVI